MKAVPKNTGEYHSFAIGSIWSDIVPGNRWVIVDVVRYKHERQTRHDICIKPYERDVFRPWRTKWVCDTTILGHMEYEGHDESFVSEAA